jgi:RNA polymerase sigma-70 factor (ECF subfamily)
LAFIKPIRPAASSDAELLAAYRLSGDAVHVEQLFLRYADLIFGVCLKYLSDPEKSKDAAMDIYLQLPDKLLKHEIGQFKSWIHVVAKNHCLMQLRSQKKKGTAPLDEGFVQSAEKNHPETDSQELEEKLGSLEQCLEKLPAEQQTCVRLFFLENRCYNEIARQTGLEWNQVRSHIQNGKRNLRICMEKQEQKANS